MEKEYHYGYIIHSIHKQTHTIPTFADKAILRNQAHARFKNKTYSCQCKWAVTNALTFMQSRKPNAPSYIHASNTRLYIV